MSMNHASENVRGRVYTDRAPENIAAGHHDALSRLLDETDIGFIVLDRQNGVIRYANKQAGKALGQGNPEGKHYAEVFWPEFAAKYARAASHCADGREHSFIYYWAEKRLWEQVSVKEIIWAREPCILLSVTCVSQIVQSDYRKQDYMLFDHLLELPNGEKLEADINELASLETVSLIVIAFQRFQVINTLYGWKNGDLLLKRVRDWLLQSETRRAQLYRLNGGFALLGRGATKDDAIDRAKEIIGRFAQPWAITAAGNELSVFCPVKVGIVHGKYIRNEMRNILIRTTWMNPRSEGYAIYDEIADRHIKRRLTLRSMLIRCIQNGMKGFSVSYQPIVELGNTQWSAAEALCRWTSPLGETVSPGEFIPMTEEAGMIGQLDSWVRRKAMIDCGMLGLARKRFFLNVNLSARQMINDQLIQNITGQLEETGFPAKKLHLEITESTKINFEKENIQRIKKLEEAGIQLCLDDFGTGYSSIANLIHLPANMIKTDRILVEGIEHDQYRRYLLKILTESVHHLGKKVIVAEGVETSNQLEAVRDLGVDYVQGYYFSKPLTLEQLAESAGKFDT